MSLTINELPNGGELRDGSGIDERTVDFFVFDPEKFSTLINSAWSARVVGLRLLIELLGAKNSCRLQVFDAKGRRTAEINCNSMQLDGALEQPGVYRVDLKMVELLQYADGRHWLTYVTDGTKVWWYTPDM